MINTVEGEVNGGLKNSRSTTFGDIAKELPIYARDTRANKGKGLEVTTTLDLTDPRLRAAAQRAFTGRDPVTGEEVDRSDAANELGEAARNAANFTARTYDYDKTSDRHEVDLVVVGGAGETTSTTSARRVSGRSIRRQEPSRGPTGARHDAPRPSALRSGLAAALAGCGAAAEPEPEQPAAAARPARPDAARGLRARGAARTGRSPCPAASIRRR